MKIFFQICFMFVMGGVSSLSAHLSVNPQDPAFLDSFNEQQKNAIHQFLNQELGNRNEDNATITEADLKQLYSKHLESWSYKIDQTSLMKNKNQKKVYKTFNNENNLGELLRKSKCDQSSSSGSQGIPITSQDIGHKGIVIKKPGHYYLKIKKGILSWDPSRIANLITIAADNVILDLNATTIIQKSSNSFASTAIYIRPEHQNITIRNGSFVGFTADTIFATSTNNLFIEDILITDNVNRQVYNPSDSFASIKILSSSNTFLRDITISNTVVNSSNNILVAGILFLNTHTFLVENCEVARAKMTASTISQCVGISTILSTNGVIDNCRVSNCVSNGIMPAFGYVGSQNILTRNCIANYNTGVQTTSGYYPQISDSLQFINCEANNNHSTCQDCHGFPYFISTNGFFSNCRALNNAATNPSGRFNEKVTGFEILVCVNCVVDNCEAYNNTTTNPIRHYAAGFANGNSSHVIFKNCTSIGNTAIGNTSRGVGFGPALDPRFFGPSTGTIWENCIAEGNFGDTQSIGFDLFGQIGAILSGSISQNHGSSLINNGIGILSNGPYDEGNPVDVPCNVVPIVVITENKQSHVLVKDNIVANNSFAGILDTTDAGNAYINNTLFNNGSNFIGSIFNEGTPIRNWTVESAPSDANNNGVVGDKLDNLNVATS